MINFIRNSAASVDGYFTLSPKDINRAIIATSKFSGTGAYVYYLRFVAKGGTRPIYKVGFTTNYTERLRALAKEYPHYKIEEVTKMWFSSRVVAYAIEQKLHTHFRQFKYPCTIRHIELYSADVFNPELHASDGFRLALTRLISIKNHAIVADTKTYKIADMRTLPTAISTAQHKKRA
jgi:hypothetical protein